MTDTGGKPRIRQDTTVEPHSIGFWPDLWTAVCEIADKQKRSVSEYVREVLVKDLERRAEEDDEEETADAETT
jgi:hypothetical protein